MGELNIVKTGFLFLYDFTTFGFEYTRRTADVEICKTRHLALPEVVRCSKQPLHPRPHPAGETQSVRPGVTRLEVWLAETKKSKKQKTKKNQKPEGASSSMAGGGAGRQAG